MTESDFERRQEEEAAAEAAAIGGQPSSEPSVTDEEQDPALQPLREAGQGEAEGFEEAERELVEHASHGDVHAARRVLEDAPPGEEDERASEAGEADSERTSERPDN
jgi:hypothetical protein